MLNNDTMSDDEVVASYVPPRYLIFFIEIEAEVVFLFTVEAAMEAMKMSGSGEIFFKYKN